MVMNLLPATAQAFAARAPPTIVLSTKVEQWLTQSLKRINKIKRPLNSVPQHFRCLTETLSGDNAIWTLCSMMLPNKPDADLLKDSNPLVEAMFNYQLLHIEAYVVHVDMVSQHEVAFKLTKDTIAALVEYHKEIYSVDVSASTWEWPEKETQLKKLHDEFVQAINKFVFRTGVRALEGLEEDGAGELLDGRSDEVKISLNGLFQPLLPPPPRIVDVVRPAPILPSTAGNWWQPNQQNLAPPQQESWRILPSTPSPTISACTEPATTQPYWTNPNTTMSMDVQLPSPAPSYSQPCYTSDSYYSPPMPTASVACSMPNLPLPSLLTPCATAANGSFGGFAWSFSEPAPVYAYV